MKKKPRPDAVPRNQDTAAPDVPPPDDALFGRVASILEQARTNVVRAVNHNMVVAYWLIGREIVMELQRGQERAGYGDDLIAGLSRRLTERYGDGFSVTNIKAFRLFFMSYPEQGSEIGHTVCAQFVDAPNLHDTAEDKGRPRRLTEPVPAFSSLLSWSHYRLLMRVNTPAARTYYESEAIAGSWSVRQLERQIHSHCYERLIATQMKRGARFVTGEPLVDPIPDAAAVPEVPSGAIPILVPGAKSSTSNPLDSLKDPYVLEFLDIPDPAALHESGLEAAIIAHLRDFLLELGKGFAFVARQKRLSFDYEHLYVDLVFYSIPLRCYLLIDLKTGKLTPGDVGQMDSYVRMFDDLMTGPEDNPTIGLILCTEHNSAVARYSVLNDRTQIFASRYVTCLPTEAELAAEIQRSRALIEGRGG